MDPFTRNYSIGLGLLVGAALLTWAISSWNPDVARLNKVLEADAELAGYPYPFRVGSFEDGVATLKSPRSFEVPVIRFLAVIDPRLAGRPDNDPEVVAAQAALVHHQKRAQELVERQPDVKSVRWMLDRAWYAARGLALQ